MSTKLRLSARLTFIYAVSIVVGLVAGMILFPIANAVRLVRKYVVQLRLIWQIQPVEQREEVHG